MKHNLSNKILIPAVMIFSSLVLLGAFLLIKSMPSGEVAVISKDNKIIKEIDLSKTETPYTIDLGENVVLIEKGQIRMTKARCPDKTCVKQGVISKKGEAVICLPNKIIVEIR